MRLPEKHIAFWDNVFGADVADDPVDMYWEEIHLRSFKCCHWYTVSVILFQSIP